MVKTRLIVGILIIFHTQFYALPQQPQTKYSHGLGGSEYEVNGLVKKKVIHQPAEGIQFKNERDSCLGHGINVTTLNEKIDPQQNYIFYGISCGGVGIINHLAKHGSDHAKAIILDATPADIINLAEEVQYRIGVWALWTRAQKEWAVRKLFPEYPKQSVPPVQAIANITNKELPVFIVHSHNDPVVDIRSAWENYKAFKQAGFKNVYLCELQKGGHMNNAYGEDSIKYIQALNSFYKKHNLKHDKKHATLSNEELQQLQPTEEEINQKLSCNLSKLRKQGLINFGVYAAVEQLFSGAKK